MTWDVAMFGRSLSASRQLSWLVVLLPVWIGTLLLHELAHAAACRAVGARPGDLGLGFFLMQPILFVDITDLWMVPSRRRRACAHAAGPVADGMLCTTSLAVLSLVGHTGPVTIVLAQVVALTGLRVVVNINPLLRLDGYFVLMEIVGVNDLQRKSYAAVRKIFGSNEAVSWSFWSRAGLILFGVSSSLFTVWLLVVTAARLSSWLSAVHPP